MSLWVRRFVSCNVSSLRLVSLDPLSLPSPYRLFAPLTDADDLYSHVGDGNVHSLALFTNDEELAVIREAVHDMVHRAIRLGGTCTGEHGVGNGKTEYLEEELGPGTVGLMETVKRTSESVDGVRTSTVYLVRTWIQRTQPC